TRTATRRDPAPPPLPEPQFLVSSASASRVQPIRETLPNGLTLVVYPNHANPDIFVSGFVRAGSFMDPPGKSGVANFTAAMLSHGAGGRTEEQIASQLDFVGATVDMMAGGASTVFQ